MGAWFAVGRLLFDCCIVMELLWFWFTFCFVALLVCLRLGILLHFVFAFDFCFFGFFMVDLWVCDYLVLWLFIVCV